MPTPSIHRLRPGLPGYLIPFAPLAFAPQRQLLPSKSPSPPVFFPISTHFTATPGIPPASAVLQHAGLDRFAGLSPAFQQPTRRTACAPFTPSNSGQRSSPTCYRGCWHVVSRDLFVQYRHYLPVQKRFTTRRPSSLTRRRWVRVSPIAQNSPLLPPVGVWTVSQFQCGRTPSQAGYPSSPW